MMTTPQHSNHAPMLGQMMNKPLLISGIIKHADRYFGDNEIVSRRAEGDIHRTTYKQLHQRAKQLANALAKFGIGANDRVATLAWNGYRHLELYYAVSGSGSILHTINPRLHADQISYLCNHTFIRNTQVVCIFYQGSNIFMFS